MRTALCLQEGPLGSADSSRTSVSERETGTWIALAVIVLVVLSGRGQDLLPSPARLAIVLIWPVVAVLYAWSRSAWVVVFGMIAAGFVLRWVEFWPGGGSDVLPGTTEWIRTFLSGQDPYSHFYTSTQPPGSPVPYPPIQFYLHLPGYLLWEHTGVRFTQIALATVAMIAFGVLAARISWVTGLVALALYAVLGNLVTITVDGGMDTGFGVALLFAVLATWWALTTGFEISPTRLAGVATAVAIGVKQPGGLLAVVLFIFVVRRGGFRAASQFLLAVVVTLIGAALPFLLLSFPTFIQGLTSFIGVHDTAYGWNIWVLADQLSWPTPDVKLATVLNIAAMLGALGALTAVLFIQVRPRMSTCVLAGAIVLLVAFLTLRWSSYSYYAALAPLILVMPIVVAWERAGGDERATGRLQRAQPAVPVAG